jgi:hypothetical protein
MSYRISNQIIDLDWMVPGNEMRPMSGTLFAISVSLMMFWAAAEGNFLA